MSTIDYGIIALYMLAMIVVGFIAKGKIQTMDDFILGGKRFNKFALIGTIMATMVGSGMTMGAVGNVYTSGITGSTVWIYVGFALGLVLLGFMSKSIRATGARSLAEVIHTAFGRNARLASAVVVVLYAVALVAINIAGLRTIIIYVFGENLAISIPAATALAACISIAYTALGGFFAVVWTDTIQLGIMIIGVFTLGPIIGLSMTDGLPAIATAYEAEGLSMTNPLATGFEPYLLGFALSYFLACPGDPTMPQRVLSAKDDHTSKFSFIVSGGFAIYFGVAILIMGGCIHLLMPALESPDAALPLFVLTYYPPILKGLTIAGIIAAIMSSFDSFLILATTHIMYDIGRSLKPDLSEDTIKKSLPILTIVIGVLGVFVALYVQSLLGYLTMVFSIISSALTPALFSALFFKKQVSKTGAFWSIIVGTIVPAALFLTKGYDVFLGDPIFLGLFSAIAALILGSIIFKDKKEVSV